MAVISVLVINIGISIAIYVLIALVLIAVNGKTSTKRPDATNLVFDELRIDYSDLPPLSRYRCRDGSELDVRYYPSDTDTILILIHGSGWHSRYFLPMTRFAASENLAHVYTPDLRGHGEHPSKRGDIDYFDQLEDDLADLISFVETRHPGARIILGGHSSGGGLVIRFGAGRYRELVSSYLLLSPFLKYNAATMKPDSGGWAHAYLPRIVGLSMLNNIGMRFLNGLDVIDFNMPETYRDGTETLVYSHRLNTGFAPRNYKKDLVRMKGKLLLVVGAADESFVAEAFLPIFAEYCPIAEVHLLAGVSHIGLVVGEDIRPVLREFMQ